MGISYEPVIMVGLRYNEFNQTEIKLIDNLIDEDEIQYASPYYDAPRKDWIVGYRIATEGEVNSTNMQVKVLNEKSEFFFKFNRVAKMFLTMDVS